MSKFEKQLRKLPSHIRLHCNDIIKAIKGGISVSSLGAKYLECCKGDVRKLSVRLSRSYRLIIEDTESGLNPVWIGSHQEYDKWIRR